MRDYATILEAPGEIPFDEASVSAEMTGNGILTLGIWNDSSVKKEITIDVSPIVIGRETVVSRELTGYRDETVCEGDVCRLERVPIYKEVRSENATYGFFEAVPARLNLEGNAGSTVAVRLKNRDQASIPFLLSVYVTFRDGSGTDTLRIDCSSSELLR